MHRISKGLAFLCTIFKSQPASKECAPHMFTFIYSINSIEGLLCAPSMEDLITHRARILGADDLAREKRYITLLYGKTYN